MLWHLTLGAKSPIRDVGFVNVVAVIIGRREARSRAHRAIDIDHTRTLSTDEMVVVIVDAVLVTSRGTDGLNPAQEIVFDEHGEGVIDRLTRNAANINSGHVDHLVSAHVGSKRNCPQYRESLRRYLDPVLAELIDGGECH
jgi:hypothetical protein